MSNGPAANRALELPVQRLLNWIDYRLDPEKFMMKLASLLLSIFAIAFLALGAHFLVVPTVLTLETEIALPTAVAVQEVRGVYGGFFLGTGLYLLLCARRQGWLHQGLAALASIMGGLVLGRVTGLVLDGPANALLYFLLGSEIAGLLLSLHLLRRVQ
jgi:hypothetical protein